MTKMQMVFLEALKEAIGSGFEAVVAYQKASTDESVNQRGLLQDIEGGLFHFFNNFAPSYLQPKLLYYKFKHYQLLADTYTSVIEPIMVDIQSYTRGGNDESALQSAMEAMQNSIVYWKQMAAHNYFGSEYVMADPYKEGAEIMNRLGTLQCLMRNFPEGLTNLMDSYELKEATLDNYRTLRIASRKTIFEGQVSLAETLLNYGVCAVEQYDHLITPVGLANCRGLSQWRS